MTPTPALYQSASQRVKSAATGSASSSSALAVFRLLASGALLSTVLVSGAMAQSPSPVPTPAAASAAKQAIAKLDAADAAFLKQVARNSHAEVQGSRIAVEKATNTQVKGFAQQMVDEHLKAAAELDALAAAKGVKLPEGPSLMQRARLKLLASSTGDTFDRRYANGIGVQAHEDTVALFQKAAMQAQDPDVKAFASRTLPTLQHHLDMAREMKASADKAARG